MPIPKHWPWYKRLRAWWTWADLEQAVGLKSMGWRKYARWFLH